jgi:hypothetical protein
VGEQKYKEGDELVQSILYACVEFSHLNPLVLLIYDSSTIK